MKKVILAIILIFVAITLHKVVKSPASSIINYYSDNVGVVAFGDSLTYGVGATVGGGYVKMLEEDLNIHITNLGVSGDTTIDALNRISEVTRRKPRVTIVLLGGNDFFRGIPEEDTFVNLGTIIQNIQGSGSTVILVGIEPLIAKNGEREAFDRLAKKHKTAYVPDVLDSVYGNPSRMSDDIHPNDQGYRIMAERIKPVLENLLDN